VQEAVAAAVSLIDSARMHAYRAADDIETASVRGVALDVSMRARVRMDTGVVMRRCREALDRILDAGGAGSFARTNPLQRLWRDLTVASRHAAVSPLLNGEIYGRAVLGVEKQVTQFV
jgi:alkylation response protein AidB-like acyl-CoA dehydrogenase